MSKFFTRKELAELFDVNLGTINNWRKKGMPFIQLGSGRIVYDPDAVERWLLGK